ncbi:DOMON domain-containing protein [Chloroflexota bacterium]
MKILRQNRNHFFLFLICIILPNVVGLNACAGPAPTPTPTPTPTPIPTPTPTLTPTPPFEEEWSADGIIKVREYHGSNIYGDFEIHWRSDDQYAYMGIKAKTSGYISMAVQPGSRMKAADMVFGFVKNGETAIYDLFSTGDFGPHPPDTELGGTNDILKFAGSEQDGFITIEFKRKLVTGDKYDNPLSKGANEIIWAYGSTDDFSRKHTSGGYGEINL